MDLQALLDSKLFISLASAIGGGILTRIFSLLKGKIQTLEYTVRHDRVGLSVEDAIFGSVKATWQGYELTNLFSSIVTLENNTTKDFKNLVIKAYTGDSQLLNERVEIQGSTYIPVHTTAFKTATHVEPGEQPADWQLNLYRHNREYEVVALNRGQKVVLQYLTTEPNQNNTPSVWLDIQQEGVRAIFKPIVPEVHGIPIKKATPIGIVACLLLLLLVGSQNTSIWVASCITLVAGIFAQRIGALIYKSVRTTIRFFSQ
jgi:hypothetical protein